MLKSFLVFTEQNNFTFFTANFSFLCNLFERSLCFEKNKNKRNDFSIFLLFLFFFGRFKFSLNGFRNMIYSFELLRVLCSFLQNWIITLTRGSSTGQQSSTYENFVGSVCCGSTWSKKTTKFELNSFKLLS